MNAARLARFGSFELNPRSGEFRKLGNRIRLRDQSLQVLLMLIERPGEVVLRSEIQAKLWPGEELSDLDQRVNAAVSGLRAALNDSGAKPLYVETLVKRGYRFLGEVEWVELEQVGLEQANEPQQPRRGSAADGSTANVTAADVTELAETPPVQTAESQTVGPAGRRFPWLRVGAAASLLIVAAGVLVLRGRSGQDELPPQRTVPLTTFEEYSQFPDFSPDGEKVVYSRMSPPRTDGGRSLNLYIQPVGNGSPIRITDGASDDITPRWSPDGTRIAFQRNFATGRELLSVPAGGGTEQKISDIGAGLSWSPDGKEIAYIAPYAPRDCGCVVVRTLATGAVRPLTNAGSYKDTRVAWSPDGKLIAFARSLGDPGTDLFVMPAAGGTPRRLTFDKAMMGGMAWTPDSRELVFESFRQEARALWRISAEGGSPSQVNTGTHDAGEPAISRRGHRLAFREEYFDSNIRQYKRSGSGDRAPMFDPSPACLICSTVEEDSPRFSPDGRKIVFVSKRTGRDEIWIAGSDGNSPQQLTTTGGSPGSPSWSPDGRWIAYDAQHNGNLDVFVVSSQGGTPRPLTAEPSRDGIPAWSHDGRWIYFVSNREDRFEIWKVPYEGGAPVRLTRNGGGEPREAADGRRLYYWGANSRLWNIATEGGPEEMIPELRDFPRTRAWAVRPDGIYFFHQPTADKRYIRFFDFATRKVTTVLEPARDPVAYRPGIDVSPDGRGLIYTQIDRTIEGLFLIENFR